MKVLEIRDESLVLADRPIPRPGLGEVQLRISAAGVNRADILQRDGKYPPPKGASDIPGLEASGIVSELGPNVGSLKVGDEVCVLLQGGAFAEYCIVSEELCLPIPKATTLVESAAIPETFFTVWDNVFRRGRLGSGETFLVHGGTSGIGTTAIQLAKYFGAQVITTSGSDKKANACRSLGADLSLNYKTQDFEAEVREFTQGRGVNVILDMIGGDYFPKNLRSLAVEGRLIQIGLQHGSKVDLLLHQVMQKRLSIMGSTLRARSVEEKKPIKDDLITKVWPLLDNGDIKAIVQESFSFTQANNALDVMESGQLIGKLLLIPD